ncbi:MAG: hypothetical protein IT422_19455 [Pirellulaceae bacterium]|nr:hypothetical protein [Pirellulaceae bacterium]
MGVMIVNGPIAKSEDERSQPNPDIQTTARTNISIYNATRATDIGLTVSCDGLVVNPVPGRRYRLNLQYRLHTKPGENGPILKTESHPGGFVAKLVDGTGVAGRALDLPRGFDVVRRDFRGLQGIGDERKLIIVRVEPHIVDLETDEYLTTPKTDAAILVCEFMNGWPHTVRSFSNYLGNRENLPQSIERLFNLDAYDPFANGIFPSIEKLLEDDAVADQHKVILLKRMPREWVFSKSNLPGIIGNLEQDENPEVAAAAQKLLAEAR